MPTLLIRLEAPMQSYGIFGKFGEKDTAKEPSKSAVIGLICSALGIPRNQDISWLTKLKFGVRIDKEGIIKNDYHVAGTLGYHRASGSIERKTAIPTNRAYLSDAAFLVGIESQNIETLQKINNALKKPKWQIYLGKKSFVPSTTIYLHDPIKNTSLLQSLKNYPYDTKYLPKNYKSKTIKLRYVLDIDSAENENIIIISKTMDVPINFQKRIFAERETATLIITKNLE